MFDISVNQFIHSDSGNKESFCCKHIDVLLNTMNEKEFVVMEATVATVAIFDVPTFRSEHKNVLVGEVSAAAPVGAGRAPPAHSTPKPGFGSTWPEESASLCSLY